MVACRMGLGWDAFVSGDLHYEQSWAGSVSRDPDLSAANCSMVGVGPGKKAKSLERKPAGPDSAPPGR